VVEGFDEELAAAGHGLDGVADEIEDDAFDVTGVDVGVPERVGGFEIPVDALGAGGEAEGAAEERGELGAFAGGRVVFEVVEEVLGEFCGAACGVVGDFEFLLEVAAFRELVDDHFDGEEDGGEGVIEFVGDEAGGFDDDVDHVLRPFVRRRGRAVEVAEGAGLSGGRCGEGFGGEDVVEDAAGDVADGGAEPRAWDAAGEGADDWGGLRVADAHGGEERGGLAGDGGEGLADEGGGIDAAGGGEGAVGVEDGWALGGEGPAIEDGDGVGDEVEGDFEVMIDGHDPANGVGGLGVERHVRVGTGDA
jgi:hypothetical protein